MRTRRDERAPPFPHRPTRAHPDDEGAPLQQGAVRELRPRGGVARREPLARHGGEARPAWRGGALGGRCVCV